MLQRWKLILTNWINCYFNKSGDEKQQLSIESLVTIISHLRENLNLDESKSSLLEAHTVDEFLCEKYPEFKFENGTVEACNEEEICLSASVLLFFVCVNSKNLDIKNAMCSKLSRDNQETIMKFSKYLMECPVITVAEVQAAITEACGQDIAAMDIPRRNTVAETPPALRSMHNNIRRLQAELEAERFDRNYLQEELSRTNNKLERLLKDKEHYKLKILNLKAKISLCCGEGGGCKSTETSEDISTKLSQQLHQLELTLEETQAQLQDVAYERDQYKAKIDELKNDRDKWLALCQQENDRVSHLSDELETERRHNQSLKDLVTELRQHNKFNGLDTSSLECDDPDASIHSLHNSSICSEACANVVEVQLSEERAKIVVLQQQMQILQVQINELNQMRENEKSSMENVVAQRENEICDLKHRINEEIEMKNNLKARCDYEVTKLNNEINELEQKLKDNNEHSRNIIERKMEEIQTLQEEKLSLLHSLNNETTKLENIIKELRHELDSEKQSRLRMKETYENQFMKLNEKVLNRNNELVELQNSIFTKAEEIETLQIDIRNEKEAFGKLMTQYESLSEEKNATLTELRNEKQAIKKLLNENQILIDQKTSLHTEMKKEKASFEEFVNKSRKIEKEKDTIEIKLRKEKELLKELTAKYHAIEEQRDVLQNDMKKIKDAGKKLQNKYHTLHEHHKELKSEHDNLKQMHVELQNKYKDLEKHYDAMRNELSSRIDAFKELQHKYNEIFELNNTTEMELKQNKEMVCEVNKKHEDIEMLNKKILTEISELKKAFVKLTTENEELIKQNSSIQDELEKEREAFKELTQIYRGLTDRIDEIDSNLKLKCDENNVLKQQNNIMKEKLDKEKESFEQLTQCCRDIKEKKNLIEKDLKLKCDEVQTLKLQTTGIQEALDIEKRAFQELTLNYRNIDEENTQIVNDLKARCDEIAVLKLNNDAIQNDLTKEKEAFKELMQNYRNLCEHKNVIENELKLQCDEEQSLKLDLETKVQSLEEKLTESECLAEKLKTSYECQIENLNVMVTTLSNYLKEKTTELEALKNDKEILQRTMENNSKVITSLQEELQSEQQNIEKNTSEFESEILVLKNMVTVTESVMEDTKICLSNEISELSKRTHSLETAKNQLQALLNDAENKCQAVEIANASLLSLLRLEKKWKEEVEKESEMIRENLDQVIKTLIEERKTNASLIVTLKSQERTLTEDNDNLQRDLNNVQSVNRELETAVTALQDESKSLKKELQNCIEEKNQLEKALQETAKNLAAVQLEAKELNGVIMGMADENNYMKQRECESNAKIKDMNATIVLLESEVLSQGNKLKILPEDNSQNILKVQDITEKLTNALMKKSQVECKLQETQLEVENLRNKIIILTEENNNLKLEENEYYAKMKELEGTMNTLGNELRSEIELLSNEKSQVQGNLESLKVKMETILEEKSTLEIALQDKTENVLSVQTENKELQLQVAALTDENNNLIQENNNQLAKLVECDTRELDLKNDLEAVSYLNKNLSVALKAVENELTIQHEQLVKLAEEKQNLESALEEKTQSLKEVQQKLLERENKITDFVELVNNLKQDKENSIAEIEELKVKLQGLNEVQKDNIILKNSMIELEKLFEAKDDKLQTVLNIKCQVESEVHTRVVYLAQKLEDFSLQVQKSIQEKNQNLLNVQLKIKNLENRVTSLFNEKDNLVLEKQTLSAQIEQLKDKIKDVDAVENDNQELKSTMTVLENELKIRVEKLQIMLQEKSAVESELKAKTDLVVKVSEEKSQIEEILRGKVADEKSHIDIITKLTNYLKEKTAELETLRKDKEVLQQTVTDSCKVIKTLENNVKSDKQTIVKLTSDFESERQVLKNMVSATESVMEDTKLGLQNEISQHLITKNCLEAERNELKLLLIDLEMANASLLSLLKLERQVKQDVEKESQIVRDHLDEIVNYIGKERNTNISVISALEFQEKAMVGDYEKIKNDLERIQASNQELKLAMKALENDLKHKEDILQESLKEKVIIENKLKTNVDQLSKVLQAKTEIEKVVDEKTQNLNVFQLEIQELKKKMAVLFDEKNNLEMEKKESAAKVEEFKAIINSSETKEREDLIKLKIENQQLLTSIEDNRVVISNLEQLIQHELEENHKLRDDYEQEKIMMSNRCSLLQDYQTKAEKVLEDRQKEIQALQKDVQMLQSKVDVCDQDSKAKDGLISKMSKEKDAVISTISKELVEEKNLREKLENELQKQKSTVNELRNNIEIRALKKENEQLIRAIGQQETFTALSQEKASEKYAYIQEPRDSHQVDSTSSDNTHSSVDSIKTITDLENIIHDKNRTITTLQTDITYLKTGIAESEIKVLDLKKELEMNKDTAQQLSNQLKKIVHQKNEEIADLKKQVSKMSVTENRASQIIKVSAKYQAMILKRIAEIKSNTVLKELTNLGNSDNELRRSLNAGSVTMEDLENFLETTDRHLKRCAEKQIALQKDRDRLTEVNRINESEIINLRKFLTELSVSFQTFSSVKELYANKLSRVVSIQRTVRREILSLDGRISDSTMCKLERGYGATMQDLTECAMNLERWVERCISRTVSVEKIKQAFTCDIDRSSLSSPSFQYTGLEIQLEELEKSFQKLLEEIARAVKNEGTTESQAATVIEVRAEYEDKLNRMKAKMKDLFNEQMAILKNKQKEEILLLERELEKTRRRMEDSKRAYESHIKELTKELWSVGEKYLVKNDEAEWLRRKQRSGSLMSLQHVRSSGLVPPQELPSRPSDAHSLRSLPITDNYPKNKRDGRGLHMSDEEGEVFDNRALKELEMTPRRDTGQRLSELKWRNSLCPPHLKSSYPAETQFAPTIDEDDLKAGGPSVASALPQRKEVGITAYKKPGPPTPSKQAGRLSATDSELRESLRVESDPHAAERKTSTPARFRAFLRFNKHDHSDGTPRKRLSNIFRKK